MIRKPRHPDWCHADHRCNLGEHRSDPIVVDIPHHARGVLTRVHHDATGADHAELRIRVALHPDETIARHQLQTLLGDIRDALTRATTTRPTRHGQNRRAA